MAEIANATLTLEVNHLRHMIVKYLTEHTLPELQDSVDRAVQKVLNSNELNRVVEEQVARELSNVVQRLVSEVVLTSDIRTQAAKTIREKLTDSLLAALKGYQQ
jgi:hypothetical protein